MKVSSCCGADYTTIVWYESIGSGKKETTHYCCCCEQPCQLVDKPVEPAGTHITVPQVATSNLFITMTPMGVDPACPNCNDTGKVDIYNANAELKDIPCPACQPVAQSSSDLDELMPLVMDRLDMGMPYDERASGFACGSKAQLKADKSITARLLAEKDKTIECLRKELEESVAISYSYKGDYDLLADEHRVYRDKIKELERDNDRQRIRILFMEKQVLVYSKETVNVNKALEKKVRRIKELEADNLEYEQTFDMIHKASVRAIKMWQEANPGHDLEMPDTATLEVWLMERIDELKAELAKLKAPFRDEVSGAWIEPCPKTK